MNKIKHIIPISILLTLGACSTEETIHQPDVQAEGPVEFIATKAGEEEDTNQTEYEAHYFKEGDQIRIYCPTNYSTPSFEDNAEGMFVYEYTSTQPANPTDWSEWPYRFVPVSEGFNWLNLQPTSIYYFFEAIHFPGGEYLDAENFPQDQSTPEALDKADMLIAHHRQLLEDKGKAVPLTFYHAFAMVRVKVKLPVSKDPTLSPFPPDALQEVYMRAMLVDYTINFSGSIDNDGLRVVRVPSDPDTGKDKELGRHNIIMCQTTPKKEETKNSNDDQITYQEYVYQGIVPEQSFIDEGRDFLFFKVKRHDSPSENVVYKFTIDKTFSLRSSHILNLELSIDKNDNEIVVVTAEVKPWKDAVTDDMIIAPVPNN
ncbi:fimbrillin family protein [Parabacteroides sp.]